MSQRALVAPCAGSLAWLAFLTLLAGCAVAAPPLPPMPATATSTSSVCQSVVNRFIGLPEKLAAGEQAGAPMAGRWWIRRCQSDVQGADVHVRLEGPGWYWVDRGDDAFRVQQNVYFHVTADLVGHFQTGVSWQNGVVSLWFHPSKASVRVKPLGEIRPRAQSPLLAILERLAMPLPYWNVADRARQQLEQQASAEFEHALSHGYTLVFDVARLQPDFALDLLPPGQLPEHPYQDAGPWLANERLLLEPGALHVLGPFDASDALSFDTRITRGSGISYRAVCAPDLRNALERAERGDATSIPATEIVDTGRIERSGRPSTRLSVPDCGFYLVLSTSSGAATQADVRVRG